MANTKIGLLPLYIELYDQVGSSRARLQSFYDRLAEIFEGYGIEVLRSDFCRLKDEFAKAVTHFEEEGATCIVTFHAAYSPSLESAEVLANTKLPIIVLDTTETYDFGPEQNKKEISYCHGIHGVMDMCNLLRRNGKAYVVAAGHFETSDVIARVLGYIKAAKAAMSINGSKVGIVGDSFDGMGDFFMTDEELKDIFGVTVVRPTADDLNAIAAEITDQEVADEIADDLMFNEQTTVIEDDVHEISAKTNLTVRKWIDKDELDAFTVCFRDVGEEVGLKTMPFAEASKAMSRGIGYAGEGDMLTAVFTGAFIKAYKDASFIEIFCPDWKNNTLFLSHMGEINLDLTTGITEVAAPKFIYGGTGVTKPVVIYGRYKGGDAVFVNVYRDENGFNIVTAPVEMMEYESDRFENKVRGWMKPQIDIADFLEQLSTYGGTHHSSLIYGATVKEIEFFGKILGLNVHVIK